MSRRQSPLDLRLSLLILGLMIGGVVHGSAQVPLIQRATPDPARQARSAAWLDHFGTQSPALLQAVHQLERERDLWRSSSGVTRCRRAHRALSEVDRGGLLRTQEYQLVSVVGEALDELDGALRACWARRYFELEYRVGLARRSLGRARALAEAQSSR